MGTLVKKRGRGDANTTKPAKRRVQPPPAVDSDIDSSDAEGHEDLPASPPPEDGLLSLAPEAPPNETTEERRLRLAREYLRQAGVSEDAAASSDDDDDEDTAGVNDQLRQSALQESGRAVEHIADDLAPRLRTATGRACCGHRLPPTCVVLAPDEETAVSGGKDGAVIVWNVETGGKKNVFKEKIELRHKRNPARAEGHVGQVHTVAMTDDGNLCVSGGDDALLRVWDLRAGKMVECLKGHRGPIRGLAFRAGSRQLFSASKDRTVKVWDMNDMAYVETLFGHGGEVNGIDSLAKERALSCGRDGTLRLYKVVEGSQLVFRRAMTVSIDVVAMVNEQRFVSGGDDGAVCLWQLNKKKPTAVAEHAHGYGLGCESWVSAVSAFRNTDLVVSGGGDGRLRLWKCQDVPKLIPVGEVDIGLGFVNGIAVGRRRSLLAVAVGKEHRLGRWSAVRNVKNTIRFLAPGRHDNSGSN